MFTSVQHAWHCSDINKGGENIMKYEAPKFEVLELTADVITTSEVTGGDMPETDWEE